MRRKWAIAISLAIILNSSVFIVKIVGKNFQNEIHDTPPVHNINTGEYYFTIQAALNDPLTQDGHTITVDCGVYYGSVEIEKSIHIIGAGIDKAIIDGLNDNIPIRVSNDVNNFTIEGFTLTNGGGFGPAYAIGGGICVKSKIFNIKHVKITDCIALEGGGICVGYSQNYDSVGIIENCIIINNQAGRGGGAPWPDDPGQDTRPDQAEGDTGIRAFDQRRGWNEQSNRKGKIKIRDRNKGP